MENLLLVSMERLPFVVCLQGLLLEYKLALLCPFFIIVFP